MSKLENYSDEKLLQQMQNGEIAAFEELYDRYWTLFYKEAASRVARPDAVAQIVEGVFISLWQNRNDIRLSVYSYCYSSLRARVFQYLQKEYIFLKSIKTKDTITKVGCFAAFKFEGSLSENKISRVILPGFLRPVLIFSARILMRLSHLPLK